TLFGGGSRPFCRGHSQVVQGERFSSKEAHSLLIKTIITWQFYSRVPGSRCLWRLASIAGFFFSAMLAYGTGALQLAWDPNSEPNIAGYKVYYGTSSGTYTQDIDVGNKTTTIVGGLTNGTTYYLVVTAYDTNGLESDPSNEVSYTVPTPTPTPTPT